MNVILQQQVLGFQRNTRIAETVPGGAVVEISRSSPNGWIDFSWNGSDYSAYCDELLKACTVEEVSRLTLRGLV